MWYIRRNSLHSIDDIDDIFCVNAVQSAVGKEKKGSDDWLVVHCFWNYMSHILYKQHLVVVVVVIGYSRSGQISVYQFTDCCANNCYGALRTYSLRTILMIKHHFSRIYRSELHTIAWKTTENLWVLKQMRTGFFVVVYLSLSTKLTHQTLYYDDN